VNMVSKRTGWKITSLGELCEITGGGTPTTSVQRYWEGAIPWVSPKDMKSEIVSDSIDHVSEEAITNSATNLVSAGSVLMVVRSGILARIVPIALAGCDLAINQDLKALFPRDGTNSRFLYLFLVSKMPELLEMVSKGATVHRLDIEKLKKLSVPVPTPAEQERIVATLDGTLESVTAAEASAQRKLIALKQLKRSILHQSFSGNL
jgi:type I restriction enzyme S subunit